MIYVVAFMAMVALVGTVGGYLQGRSDGFAAHEVAAQHHAIEDARAEADAVQVILAETREEQRERDAEYEHKVAYLEAEKDRAERDLLAAQAAVEASADTEGSTQCVPGCTSASPF